MIENQWNKIEYHVSPNKLDLLGVQLEKSPTAASQEPGGSRKRIQDQESGGLCLVLLQLFPVLFQDIWIKKTSPPWNFASIYKKINPKSVENEKS